MPSKKKQILSWCFFDFANSSFTTVVVTVIFSVYFAKVVDPEDGKFYWNLALAVSNLGIILCSPIVGILADGRIGKKNLLTASYLICVIGTALLFWANSGDRYYALIIFSIANIAFALGENLVSAFLPEIAEPEEISKVSSWGWGIGYLGGCLALFACLMLIDHAPSENHFNVRSTNLLVAAFFFLAGIPTVLWVKGKPHQKAASDEKEQLKAAIQQLKYSWQNRGRDRELLRFLFAYAIINIGVYGVIGNAGLYAEGLANMNLDAIVTIFIVSQFFAIAGAIAAGFLASSWGYIKTLHASIAFWLIAGALMITTSTAPQFWAAALTAGFAMGATLTTGRACVASFSDDDRHGESFGYWGLFCRIAAFLAPLVNAALIFSFGSLKAGIAFFALCFATGAVLLWRVSEDTATTANE